MEVWKFVKKGSASNVEKIYVNIEDYDQEDIESEAESWAKQDSNFQNNGYDLEVTEIMDKFKCEEAMKKRILELTKQIDSLKYERAVINLEFISL